MLKNSFILLDKMGKAKELSLWKQGIKEWNDFLKIDEIKGISKKQKELYDIQLEIIKNKLNNEEYDYFKKILPLSEQWRLYDFFKDEAVYLDIETSSNYGDITVVGLYDGYDTKILVKGQNLDKEKLYSELSKYKLLVTYNGTSFDVPVIEKYFGEKIDMLHMDLKTVCGRIGLKGGLKEVEKSLNICRPQELELMRGHNAVDAWKMFQVTGEQKYLDILIKYNEEDIINLKPIAEYAVKKLWESIHQSNIA